MIKSNRSHLSVTATMALAALAMICGAIPATGLTVAQRLQYVVNFMVDNNNPPSTPPVHSLDPNTPTSGYHFLSGFPTGEAYESTTQLQNPNAPGYTLQDTCYVHDNVIYAIKALTPYTTAGTNYAGTFTYAIGSTVAGQLTTFYKNFYPTKDMNGNNIPEETLNCCAIGVDTDEINGMPSGDAYGVTQSSIPYPSTSYVIATDYDAGSQNGGTPTPYKLDYSSNFQTDHYGNKDLMKEGILLELIRYNYYKNIGNNSAAQTSLTNAENYFEQVVYNAKWDGSPFGLHAVFEGFPESGDTTPKGQEYFDTRDLAYFLMCEAAFSSINVNPYTMSGGDTNKAISQGAQNIIWSPCWDNVASGGTGGIWGSYYYSGSGNFAIQGDGDDGASARLNNETAPLVLLAFEALTSAGTISAGPPQPFIWPNPFENYFNSQNSQFGD